MEEFRLPKFYELVDSHLDYYFSKTRNPRVFKQFDDFDTLTRMIIADIYYFSLKFKTIDFKKYLYLFHSLNVKELIGVFKKDIVYETTALRLYYKDNIKDVNVEFNESNCYVYGLTLVTLLTYLDKDYSYLFNLCSSARIDESVLNKVDLGFTFIHNNMFKIK